MRYIHSLLKITLVTVLFWSSSCMTTKTNVGAFKENEGNIYTYAKGKQIWLFWGFLPMGRTNVNTPGNGNCQVVTRYNVGDALISFFTLGFVRTYTIKINAKRKEQNQPQNTSN